MGRQKAMMMVEGRVWQVDPLGASIVIYRQPRAASPANAPNPCGPDPSHIVSRTRVTSFPENFTSLAVLMHITKVPLLR